MDLDEFSTWPVPRERSIAWWKIALTNVLFSICLPTLITGLDLGIAAPRRYFLSGIIVGSLILTFIGILTSVLGSRTRLSSYMLTRIAFGTYGSTLLNLAFALTLLGWFGVNIDLFGDAMARLLDVLWGYHGPIWPVDLLAGLMMTLTTLIGLRAINALSVIAVPVLTVVCLMMLLESLKHGSALSILGRGPPVGMSFGDTVSSVVGGVIVGAIIMPDTCRFIDRSGGAIGTAILTYFVSNAIVMAIGGIAALATGKVEILDLMLFMGLGTGAFAIVLGGSWILNAINLYSAALSVGVAVPNSRRGITTLVAGLGGTSLVFLHILSHFLTFLFYLSIVFVPVASIIILDYFLVRPAAYVGTAINSVNRVEPTAVIAWAAGACVAVLGSAGYVRVTGIAAVDAMLVSGIVYGVLRWRREKVCIASV